MIINMIFKLYKNKGNYFPHCEVCAKKLLNGDMIMLDRNMYYCKICGDKLRDKRIAILESKIGCKLKKVGSDSP